MIKAIKIICGFIFLMMVSSCKKEYTYNVNDVKVEQPGKGKSNVKSTTEFISIAYSDLFTTTIPNDSLLAINQAYQSFGDKKLIEDRIIRHLLNRSDILIPTNQEMRANIPAFVTQAMQKLFNRNPDAFENYFITNIIQSDITITPVVVYYALMTSNEYRYY